MAAALTYLLEPAVQAVQFDDDNERIACSIAISLKRIADALTMTDQYGQTGAAAIACAIRDGLREGRS